MKIICDQCNADLGEVSATARLILTVHCAFCGKDFGLAVDRAEPEAAATTATPSPAPVTD